jgi:ABC-2 type transport system ATP-binding protein
MITISELTKSFGSITAVHAVSLSIADGEFYGLLGPNGAGKSTLMNLLTGYLDADAGTITINGLPVSRKASAFRQQLGYVPQSLALYEELNPKENLTIFGQLYNLSGKQLETRVDALLEAVQLNERKKDRVQDFSGGMKRRLNLAASLLHDPLIILCDEPTVGVDPQSRNAIFEYLLSLHHKGKTIIYTTHYMEEAERLCTQLSVIDGGSIIAGGTVDTLLSLLPYEETVTIKKTDETTGITNELEGFGSITESADKIEIKPLPGKPLSALFALLENRHISSRLVELHRPTLEALFLHLTGRRLRD